MPMNPTVLKGALKAAYLSKLNATIPGFGDIALDFDAFLDAIAEATAEQVIAHIQSSAQISGIMVQVTSVAGVQPGPGASGPGAGTGNAPPGSIS